MTTASPGQAAPSFSAPATSGKTITLSDYRGKYLVLYFYPKDNTPGCTQEGQDFRDLYADFQNLNAEILGISRDSVKSHEGFKCKYEFPFELISDEDETICKLYDVIKMKNMYGKQVLGIERSTFLIDPAGTIAAEWRKVRVDGHAQEVLGKIRELAAQ
ncbi:anti-oxidant AhpCTSA family protein [Methylocaldum marinum]|uniref:thioredoxin-dependent peroxiredoxin n=1 Tax=Methylocaldum marinum TaxID=1432792 RepID=A0A250KPU4_9GAMM|nr:peroxiredoxin [Methylocaldum marinum]BBA33552.1 anti-oxidant AhpCTSA family protein [Methylocaldum marinum]